MSNYTKEFKESIIKQMLPPNNKAVSQIHKETKIPEQTLYRWRRVAKAAGMAAPGKKSSEAWSSEDKFLIVLQAAKMNKAELASFCRKKGLYVEQVEAWKDACLNANGGVVKEAKQLKKELTESKKQINNLNKDLRRKESALAETAALLVLRKKAQAVWGENEDD